MPAGGEELAEFKVCPWCAEEILAAARKCKHCGEFLDDEFLDEESSDEESSDEESGDEIESGFSLYRCEAEECDWCFDSLDRLRQHEADSHSVDRKRSGERRTCVVGSCKRFPVPDSAYCASHAWKSGRMPAAGSVRMRKISEVGKATDGGLACPKCGGTQFKVKRSGARKLGAVAVAPVALVLSPLVLARASQVKCVTCGTVYKRG